ncbi:MAG: DNA translocase FtsK [Anaerolineae bacterium]
MFSYKLMAARKKVKVKPIPVWEQIAAQVQPYRRELLGAVLVLWAVLTLLSLLSFTGGTFNEWWAGLFRQVFGWGAIPAAAGLGLLGLLLIFGRLSNEEYTLPLDIIIGLEVLFVVALTVTHLMAANGDDALLLARAGQGGGFVGWGISYFLTDLIGLSLALPFLFLVSIGAVLLIFRLNFADLARLGDWAQGRLDHLHQPPRESVVTPAPEVHPPTSLPPSRAAKATPPAEKPQTAPAPGSVIEPGPVSMPKTRYTLPPLDLLAPPAKDPTHNANARYQAQIIEETLLGFGVPVEVVEINRGPTVTQFGLKLGSTERKLPDGTLTQQRVRVNKVVALANDLALALSAAPIRIEAPVPGRPLVGIEVPNSDKTMVSLRAVIDDDSFRKGKGALRVALGKGVSGQAVSAALAEMPHLLIAGATGSGKSVCINAIITTLLFTHAPEQLHFLMIDPKMVELTSFNGIPHLLAPVVTDFEQVVGALAWVTREMERRYKLFAASGARSISSYNHKVGAKGEQLPYLVVVIDELADLMMMAPDEVERHICRIAQMARATGIHLVVATQRPSVDVVTGLIKANFPTRIAFAVTSQIDSRVILDTPGAERLLGRGDMLYMAPDSAKLLRLQGCFVADGEIRNLVNYWKSSGVSIEQPVLTEDRRPETGESRAMPQAAAEARETPWANIVAEAGKDEMLEEAIKLVTESGRASTSFLQRRLGIGYPRASRLIDQLEAEGVIGPAEGSKPREVLWREKRDEADYDEFEADVAGVEVKNPQINKK